MSFRLRFWRVAAFVVSVLALFVAAVLAYGYWHTVTHAVFYVDVRDLSGRRVRHPDAEVMFLDDGGRVLAQSATEQGDSRSFYLSGPLSCREIEKRAPFEAGGQEAYAECFERQSRTVARWIHDLRDVDLRIGGCRWAKVPVVLSREPSGLSNWRLVWPAPHAGGSPISLFHIAIAVDAGGCSSASIEP